MRTIQAVCRRIKRRKLSDRAKVRAGGNAEEQVGQINTHHGWMRREILFAKDP